MSGDPEDDFLEGPRAGCFFHSDCALSQQQPARQTRLLAPVNETVQSCLLRGVAFSASKLVPIYDDQATGELKLGPTACSQIRRFRKYLSADLRIWQGATDPKGQSVYCGELRSKFTFRPASSHRRLSILLDQLACCVAAAI